MNIEGVRHATSLLETGEAFVLVTTLETKGSSPRHAGAWMMVRDDGSIVGTVGGGPLEARAIQCAREALGSRSSRLMDYELTNADAAGLGMICGGSGVLLVEYVSPTTGTKIQLFRALLDLLLAGKTGWVVTRLSIADEDEVLVERCLVGPKSEVAGDPVCSADMLQELAATGQAVYGQTTRDRRGCYIQPVTTPETAYVFGAGHCGKSLIHILSALDFRTVIVDDRHEFANAERFPDANVVVVPDAFENALDDLPIDEQSYLVIMTRGHVFDRVVLEQALQTRAGYIGMIGSKRKISQIFEMLREKGFGDEDLGRVHAPIGLAIGAETPEEIAISIAAELVQIKRGAAPWKR